jgi:heat shock protein HslJ
MSKSYAKVSLALLAVVCFSAAAVLADKGKTVTVSTGALLPNGQELAAGDYVIHMNEANHEVQFVQKGEVMAKAPCNCILGEKKNPQTEMQFRKNAEGKNVLQQLRIAGDKKTIVLESQNM